MFVCLSVRLGRACIVIIRYMLARNEVYGLIVQCYGHPAEAATGTKMWVCWVRGSKAKSGGFLEKWKWAPSHQAEDQIWCILGFENRIEMVNSKNDVFVNDLNWHCSTHKLNQYENETATIASCLRKIATMRMTRRTFTLVGVSKSNETNLRSIYIYTDKVQGGPKKTGLFFDSL